MDPMTNNPIGILNFLKKISTADVIKFKYSIGSEIINILVFLLLAMQDKIIFIIKKRITDYSEAEAKKNCTIQIFSPFK